MAKYSNDNAPKTAQPHSPKADNRRTGAGAPSRVVPSIPSQTPKAPTGFGNGKARETNDARIDSSAYRNNYRKS